ncbi:unnamed protein product [Caenorhabditis bovis]|uniref:CDK5RAP1-like protein n=1 Tax=Caenorhabditis bovis TaxID=2654633 RepID=A0A8S1EMF7_9PELO|nr:unnamed protein product [Caenorhabditis bovis]
MSSFRGRRSNCNEHHLVNVDNDERYEEAIRLLNGLQSNAATIKKMREQREQMQSMNVPQCRKFLDCMGITSKDVDNLHIIHISGTKGKGSTSAFVERILRSSGLRTGMYTSPHLVHARERIRLDGVPIDEYTFSTEFFDVYHCLKSKYADDMPAYFKFLTLLAFQIFVKDKVDVAIIEVGIGGEYDCTNVVENPSVCGITTLDYDHISILGSKLSEIAWHKAGILKNNSIAVYSPTTDEAFEVIKKRAAEKNAHIFEAPPLSEYKWPDKASIGIAGDHQKLNVSLALQLARIWTCLNCALLNYVIFPMMPWKAGEPFRIPVEWANAIRECKWPGRSQIVKCGRITYLLDGAHTPKSMEACAQWASKEMKQLPSNTDKILLFQCTADRCPTSLLPYVKPLGFSKLYSCPTRLHVEPSKSSDITNLNMSDVEQLNKSNQCVSAWQEHEPNRNDSCVFDCISRAVNCIKREGENKDLVVLVTDGPQLSDFIHQSRKKRQSAIIPSIEETREYLNMDDLKGNGRTVCYVTYGCQMNVSDMEIVRSIMSSYGYTESDDKFTADIVLLMTCSIREGAEKKVWNRLKQIRFNSQNKSQIVGVLGCMAERVRHDLLAKKELVSIVAGPDSYRDLPRLIAVARGGSSAINVQLSLDETYADVQPVRVDVDSKTAFVSIMRGCDNMCTYCVVPFTRGRERSRPIESIVDEVARLRDEGFKQITLLGQNVNSYRDMTNIDFSPSTSSDERVPGFKTVYKPKVGGKTFTTLLERVSTIAPDVRFRFTSPHPKDFPMPLIELIAERKNLCKQLHLPAQSGDDETLERMGRGYTRELYLKLVEDIRKVVPEVFLTSDFIAGFCGETEEAHQRTLELIRTVKYSFCYVFPYSMRGKTRAHHRLTDDVPEDVKQRRHHELNETFREQSTILNQSLIGSSQIVLVEGMSKRSPVHFQGRIDGGVKAIFDNSKLQAQPGDYVHVKITDANSQTLQADII